MPVLGGPPRLPESITRPTADVTAAREALLGAASFRRPGKL